MSGIYDFTATSLAGDDVPLKRFEGQVLLIVNTASACGFTPQYKGLEALHQAFAPRGFAVLGFPCNQFGNQEPGDAKLDAAIDHLRSLNFEKPDARTVVVAEDNPTTEALLGQLWHRRDAQGRWSDGRTGDLRFLMPAGRQDATLTLRVRVAGTRHIGPRRLAGRAIRSGAIVPGVHRCTPRQDILTDRREAIVRPGAVPVLQAPGPAASALPATQPACRPARPT